MCVKPTLLGSARHGGATCYPGIHETRLKDREFKVILGCLIALRKTLLRSFLFINLHVCTHSRVPQYEI